MKNYEFPGIEIDTEILGIGHYFRAIPGNKWKIDLKLSPEQPKNFLTASNAPVLARGCILKADKKAKKPGWKRFFRISDTSTWETKTIGECPVNRSEKRTNQNQLCFVFTIDSDITVFLPQFELARTLFFHGNYLSRTAIESECLKSEFSIEVDEDDNALINVMDSSGFSLAHLNDPASRNYLSWILLDDDARKSYKSITKYQRLNGVDYKKYRRWDFQFDPPPLRNVGLRIHGQFSNTHKICFVHEIDQIKSIPNKRYRSIRMWHPEFERSILGTGHAVQPAGNPPEATLAIHDDIASNPDMIPIALENDYVSIEFNHPFHVAKITTKEKRRATIHTDGESESKLTSVSSEEGGVDHNLPGGDWNTLKDETDYEELFESKFDCFRDMVNVLIKTHGCLLVEKHTTELRQVGKSKKHLLSTDHTPRSIAVVELEVGGKTMHLLEVDTSDAEQSLSTQVLVVKDMAAWGANVKRLKFEMVRSSLRWPRKLLEELCGEGCHKGVHHPQAPVSNKGVLAPDSIAGWASRIYGWMLRL